MATVPLDKFQLKVNNLLIITSPEEFEGITLKAFMEAGNKKEELSDEAEQTKG